MSLQFMVRHLLSRLCAEYRMNGQQLSRARLSDTRASHEISINKTKQEHVMLHGTWCFLFHCFIHNRRCTSTYFGDGDVM